jgi:hypothetical protein
MYKLQGGMNNTNEEKENRYSSNLTSQKDSYLNKTHTNGLNPEMRYKQLNDKTNNDIKADQDSKQNINIKIINTNINHYIINQEGRGENNPNRESHNITRDRSQININNATNITDNNTNKKQKSINTFRNRYNVSQPQQNDSLNKSNNNNPNNQSALNRSNNNISNISNIENLKNRNDPGKFNLKNLNLNMVGGVEVKSPVLKNTSRGGHLIPPSNVSNSKYSSLIDNQTNRPSSAIILKGRHAREGSTNSVKNDQINYNVNYNSPLARSPSSNSIVHHLNRNYSSRQNVKKETPRGSNNYLSNLDAPLPKNFSPGNKTVRPSTTQEKLRINYNTGVNMMNYSTNNNQIKTQSRYEVDDILNRRGYSLSSRAVDAKQPSYRMNNEKYQTSSKI